jgi:hypothetical protein
VVPAVARSLSGANADEDKAEPAILCRSGRPVTVSLVSELPIERDEIVGLLFNVSDISATLVRIERALREDEDEAEEDE